MATRSLFKGAYRPSVWTAGFALAMLLTGCLTPALRAEDDGGDNGRVVTVNAGSSQTNAESSGMMNLDFVDQNLSVVIDRIHQASGVNFVFANDSLRSLKVTIQLNDVHWRVALEALADKYFLILDETKIADKIITIDQPKKVDLEVNDKSVFDIINLIRQQAPDINIIMSPNVGAEHLSVHLKNVPWRTALDMITKPVGLTVIDDKFNTLRIATLAQLQEEQETRMIKLNYIQPLGNQYSANFSDPIVQKVQGATEEAGKGLLEVLESVKSPSGKIIFEKHTNALVVTDTPKKLDEIEQLLFLLDTAPKQIHISVKIIEMTDSDAEQIGFNWASGPGSGLSVSEDYSTSLNNGFPFSFGGNENLSQSLLGRLTLVSQTDPTSGLIQYLTPAALAAKGGGSGFNGTQLTNSYSPATMSISGKIIMEMIRSKTKSKIIQAPLLITLDHEEAIISVGQLLRFASQQLSTTATGGEVSSFAEAPNSPINEGVTLLILPHVTGVENNIMLTVVPKLETLVQMQTFQGPNGVVLQLPQTANKVMLAKLLLRNGETAIIGGVKQTTDTQSIDEVPFLADLPIIGFLFRHHSNSKTVDDTFISIEPSIIDFNDKEQAARDRAKIQDEMSMPSLDVQDDTTTQPDQP